MAILNYTTKVDASRTVAEIQRILVSAGAVSVKVDYHEREPVAVSFLAYVGDRTVPFRIPANWEGVLRIIRKPGSKVPSRSQTPQQAKRIAWRIVKDWVEAQLAFIEAEQASLAQLFLPHAINNASGRTLYEEFAADPRFLLGAGEK